jgi:aspartate racemase
VHFALERLRESSPIEILSIVEVVADECIRRGFGRIAVLGTRCTMAGGLYDEVPGRAGIKTLTPPPKDQETIHRIIFEEIIPAKTSSTTVDSDDRYHSPSRNGGSENGIGRG